MNWQSSLAVMSAVVLVTFAVSGVHAQECTVCKGGASMDKPNATLTLAGFPPVQCKDVDPLLAFMVTNATSSECQQVQDLSSLCGCPALRDDGGCSLCSNTKSAVVTFPERTLPFLASLFLGTAPTCELLEAYLKSQDPTSSMCTVGRRFIGDYCGCNVAKGDAVVSARESCNLCSGGQLPGVPDRSLNLDNFPFETCHDLQEGMALLLEDDSDDCDLLRKGFTNFCACPATTTSQVVETSHCFVCNSGIPVPWPNATIGILAPKFGGIAPTCELYESFVSTIDSAAQECSDAKIFGSYCGCPPLQDACSFCPGEGMKDEDLDLPVQSLAVYMGLPSTTCRDGQMIQFQIPESSDICRLGQSANYMCGCSNGIYTYLDSSTVTEQAFLAWAPRISAILSMIGSSTIIYIILRSKAKRKAVYSQLLLGMSIFDFIGSIAWITSTAAIPDLDQFGQPAAIYGARGNEFTCKLHLCVQGFMLQLNFTSVLYNVSLSSYYLLVVVYGWRDGRLKRSRWWLHGPPLVVGIGLAFVGLHYYKQMIFGCHIGHPPFKETSWVPVILCTYVPVFGAILVTSVMMVLVYRKVRLESKRSEKWVFQPASSKTRPNLDNTPGKFSLRRTLSQNMGAWNGEATTPPESRRLDSEDTRDEANETRVNPVPSRGKNGRKSRSTMERQVLVQSALYLSNFYLCWSFLLVGTITAGRRISHGTTDGVNMYPFYLTCFFLAPLQGFWNALVYFRPRLMAIRSKKKRETHSKKSSEESKQRKQFRFREFWVSIFTFSCHSSATGSDSGDNPIQKEKYEEGNETGAILNDLSTTTLDPNVLIASNDPEDEADVEENVQAAALEGIAEEFGDFDHEVISVE